MHVADQSSNLSLDKETVKIKLVGIRLEGLSEKIQLESDFNVMTSASIRQRAINDVLTQTTGRAQMDIGHLGQAEEPDQPEDPQQPAPEYPGHEEWEWATSGELCGLNGGENRSAKPVGGLLLHFKDTAQAVRNGGIQPMFADPVPMPTAQLAKGSQLAASHVVRMAAKVHSQNDLAKANIGQARAKAST